MKAAVASLALLVAMVLLILVGLGIDSGWLWIAAFYLGALSVAFALVALGVALMGKDIESDRRLLIVLIALPVLSAFALAIVAILIAFGDSFE